MKCICRILLFFLYFALSFPNICSCIETFILKSKRMMVISFRQFVKCTFDEFSSLHNSHFISPLNLSMVNFLQNFFWSLKIILNISMPTLFYVVFIMYICFALNIIVVRFWLFFQAWENREFGYIELGGLTRNSFLPHQ